MHASQSKLSEDLKNGINFYVGQAVLEFLMKTIFWLFWPISENNAQPTKILMPFLSSLDNLL